MRERDEQNTMSFKRLMEHLERHTEEFVQCLVGNLIISGFCYTLHVGISPKLIR
jgi:hypothetical protein